MRKSAATPTSKHNKWKVPFYFILLRNHYVLWIRQSGFGLSYAYVIFLIIFLCRCASGSSERGASEVQAAVGCRKRRLPRPHPPPSSQKTTWVAFLLLFSFFPFKISLSNNVCITWALQKALTLLVNMMGHKAVKWIPLRNMVRALLSTSKDEIDVAQYDHILGKHCCLKLSHTTVHLYSFTPSVLLSISLSVSSPS